MNATVCASMWPSVTTIRLTPIARAVTPSDDGDQKQRAHQPAFSFRLPVGEKELAGSRSDTYASAMSRHAFRDAVEGADLDAAVALLAEDVVFRSPAVFKPYEGRETVAMIHRTVFGVFEDFRYTDELAVATASTDCCSMRGSASARCKASISCDRTRTAGSRSSP